MYKQKKLDPDIKKAIIAGLVTLVVPAVERTINYIATVLISFVKDERIINFIVALNQKEIFRQHVALFYSTMLGLIIIEVWRDLLGARTLKRK